MPSLAENFHNSISADQVAAEQLGKETRFTSIQLNGGQGIEADGHGPGLSLHGMFEANRLAAHKLLDAFHR